MDNHKSDQCLLELFIDGRVLYKQGTGQGKAVCLRIYSHHLPQGISSTASMVHGSIGQ
jgi:hypothetical protein